MEWVKTEELKPNLILAENIFLIFGSLYIPKGTSLTQNMIDKMDLIGIEGAYVSIGLPERKIDDTDKSYARMDKKFYNIYNRLLNGQRVVIEDINEVVDDIISTVTNDHNLLMNINKLKSRDSYTYRHMMNVAIICSFIGRGLKIPEEEVKKLTLSGLLHDIGKRVIPLEILNKPSALSKAEFEIIKRHPISSYEICKTIEGLSEDVICSVIAHHEREDGTGYPFGLAYDKIPKVAKIIAVADVYDAITTDRIYRSKETSYRALSILKEESHDKLSKEIVQLFTGELIKYLLGNIVRLSNGETAQVVSIDKDKPHMPMVITEKGRYDLSTHSSLYIKEVLMV